jgi:heme exporter protein B
MRLARQSVAVAMKDLRIESRGRHAFGAALPFVATMLFAFGLAVGPGRSLLRATAPGLMWLALLFAAVIAFRQAYRVESEDDAIEGFVLSRLDPAAVFLGKAAAVTVELLVLETAVVVIMFALFDLSLVRQPVVFVGASVLGTIGLSALGSLLGLLAEAPRSGEGFLPLLILPLATPVLLAGVRSTAIAAAGGDGAGAWIGLLLAFDLSILAVGSIVFEHVLEER